MSTDYGPKKGNIQIHIFLFSVVAVHWCEIDKNKAYKCQKVIKVHRNCGVGDLLAKRILSWKNSTTRLAMTK